MRINNKPYIKLIIVLLCVFCLSGCVNPLSWFNNNNNNTDKKLTTNENYLNYETHENFNILDVDNSNLNIVKNLQINNKTLMWEREDFAEEYVVVCFSNLTKPVIKTTSANSYNISSLVNNEDIFMFRVGVVKNNKYTLSKEIYYNPKNESLFTDRIYYFNESLNDYYINSQEELDNIIHYATIYKLNKFKIKLSSEYYSSINTTSSITTNFERVLTKAINEGFLETVYFSYYFIVDNPANLIIEINLNFLGVGEPKLNLEKVLTQDEFAKPYYETLFNSNLREETKIFESDNNIKLVNVETSDQLFWAVQDGATPVFESEDSTAYVIYEKAKSILKNIINAEMSEVEKALAIFDYITYNTVYDYQIVYSNSVGQNPYTQNNIITNYKSFYLEGVFDDGLAVCDGFSKAFSLLANMEGVRCYRIVGNAGGGHAWNKILLNNKWYLVDITWTEIELYDYLTEEPKEYLTRKYFLVSDADMKTHFADYSAKNKNYVSDNSYYFYDKFKFNYNNKTYNLIINSKEKAVALLKKLWENYNNNSTASMEVVLTNNVIINWSAYVKEVKQELSFNNDVLKIYDGYVGNNYDVVFDLIKVNDLSFGSVSIIQVHGTFLNEQIKESY